MADERDVAGILLAVLGELQGIRRALERRSGGDRPEVGALLRVIYAHVGERVFTTFEVLDHAEVAQLTDLSAAIVAACGAASPRKLGKLLRSVEGEPIEGLRVRRVGDVRAGVLWQLASLRVSTFAKARGFA